jgi:hypothetical protein
MYMFDGQPIDSPNHPIANVILGNNGAQQTANGNQEIQPSFVSNSAF